MDGMAEVYMSGVLIAFLFFIFLILPMMVENRKRKRIIAKLAVGDLVVAYGGLIGKVVGVYEKGLLTEVAPGVRVILATSLVMRRVTPQEAQLTGAAAYLGATPDDGKARETIADLVSEVPNPYNFVSGAEVVRVAAVGQPRKSSSPDKNL